MSSTYEDIFFYLDLTKDILKKKEVIKAIKYYIYEKNKTNIKGHYGLLIFQEEGNPIFITDKKDSSIIENAIEENWKSRPKKQSFFENGLFYIFSYIAETIRKKSRHNRIVIITDTPSDLSEDYTEALFGLVSKIKVIPTFIDIIRVSEREERFFKDDVKLNILSSDTSGGIFYLSDKKDFLSLIKKLTNTKQIFNLFGDKSEKIKINKGDYDFYSRLAKSLKPSIANDVGLKCHLCQEEICPCCADINDTLQLCEGCGAAFHNCCVNNYTIQNNIGIPHIFRCPKCDILLKIKQDEIVAPFEDSTENIDEYIESEEENMDLKEVTNINELESIEANDFLNNAEKSFETKNKELSDNGTQTVRLGGFFGKTYTLKKEGDKLVYEKMTALDNDKGPHQVDTNKIDSTSPLTLKKPEIPKHWNPSESVKKENLNQKRPTLLNCPGCGTKLKENDLKKQSCSYCGFILDN
ncbi:MAG: VWA domain-containing protein [Candidatus Lokiarchaeota archaeon]|nr:VWA domain-containing protein [Candidatus Lokiarchaeota archaeon]